MSDRDELVKAIAEGRGCGGHYNCFATSEDTAEAGRDLDAYRASVLREAAALLRAAPSNGVSNDWNWWDAATIPDSCAALLEAEAERLTGKPAEQCSVVWPLGLLGQPLGPCILTGEHTTHQDPTGCRWTPLPDGPKEEHRIKGGAIVSGETTLREAIDQAEGAVTIRYGGLPPGWQVRYGWDNGSGVVGLMCRDCSVTVDWRHYGERQLFDLPEWLRDAAGTHGHWQTWAAQRTGRP